ncbi:hypothetical protein MUP32_01155 [Candidatus Microgenomates bacterium]|nr:hypothetical protein [Candidatus Microgenomates bacterium]
MKDKAPKILLGLTVISLMVLGFVFTTGLLKGFPKNLVKSESEKSVLGEQASHPTPTSFIDDFVQNTVKNTVKNTLQNTIQNTKETVSEKVTEVKSEIIKTVEKEISDLTQSQVKSLQWQICKEWGVVSLSPTPKP